jgi:hypothetical protein
MVFPNRSATGQTRGLSLLRAKPTRRLPWRFSLSCRLLGLLYSVAWWGEPGSLRSQEAPAWIEIPGPAEVFRLEAPELAGKTCSYSALRHPTGGGRKDILEIQGARGEAPTFRLVIYRPGDEATGQQSFFVELVHQAAETGQAITRASQPAPVATKFGDFEVAELSLAHSGGPARECLGFRFDDTAPDLRITGYACGAAGPQSSSPSKSALACLIDRIDLASAGEDARLLWFFAAHHAMGPGCARSAQLSPAGHSKADVTAAMKRGKSR